MPDTTVLTNEGEKWIQSFLITLKYYGAWGKGAGVASKADTALFDECPEARPTTHKVKIADDVIKHTWTIVTTDPVTITEAGIFNDSTGGAIVFHATFTGIALLAGEGIGFTLTDEQT